MKFYNKLLITLGVFLLSNCTPKVAESVIDVREEMVEDVVTEPWRSAAPSAGPARQIKMGEYNEFDLDNGLKVIVVENHKLPRVSYQVSFNNLALYEGEQAGYVSFAGDLLSRGTKTKTKAEIDKSIDQIGASLSTSSNFVFGSSLTKHQDKLLDVMSDVLLNPSFPSEEFDKVKKQSLSGIQQSKDDPNTIAANVAGIVNYGADHPYGEVVTEETVNAIQLKSCKEYYKTYFKPNNAYLTIVGDVTLPQAKATAEKYFGNWKKGNIPEVEYNMPSRPSTPKVSFSNKEGAVQSVVRLTYPIEMKPGSKEALHSSVMNSVLGGGVFLGRLMQNLREDKAYTYGARSSISPNRLVGSFNASASVRNEVTDSSIVEFIYEMDRMANEPISNNDLLLAKNSLAGSFARSLESPQTLARYAQNIVRFDLAEDHYETYLERLDKVTISDVQNIARKYVTSGNANIIVVGNKDEVADKLIRFDGDGEIDYYDAFGKKLEISNEALPSDITPQSILTNFFNKIGGEDKWNSVKSIEMHYGMEIMGMAAGVDIYKKAPNMAAMKVGTDAITFQEQVFDGTKAMSSAQGQQQVVTEGPIYDQIKALGVMVEQSVYNTDGYNMEVKGVDNVNGESCYKLSIEAPSGNKTTEYYSTKSGLLLRSVNSQDVAPGQTITVTQDFSDYQEHSGLMIAGKIASSGMGPAPIEMLLKEVKVDEAMDDALFKIK